MDIYIKEKLHLFHYLLFDVFNFFNYVYFVSFFFFTKIWLDFLVQCTKIISHLYNVMKTVNANKNKFIKNVHFTNAIGKYV